MDISENRKSNRKLHCKNMLLGITGSVGAINMPIYIQTFRMKFSENVFVILSEAAKKFLNPYSIELISGHKVFQDLFDQKEGFNVPHIQLPELADLFLIMPATANVIGKAANGIGDDLISTSIIASICPVVFVPSMNETMWFNKIVQNNVKRLRDYGYYVIEPSEGIEVSNYKKGKGAMPPFNIILEELLTIVKNK